MSHFAAAFRQRHPFRRITFNIVRAVKAYIDRIGNDDGPPIIL
jgi:hypothetical protein